MSPADAALLIVLAPPALSGIVRAARAIDAALEDVIADPWGDLVR